MKPRRPYLLRALHEWISDSGETPHIVVDAAAEGVTVPRQFVKDGKIVLNVSFSATQMLKLGNDFVSFEARFGGVGFAVHGRFGGGGVLAWLAVGVPFFIGLYIAIEKAAALF